MNFCAHAVLQSRFIFKGLKMGKALLSLRLTVDHTDIKTPVHAHVKLYRENVGLVWRIGNPLGDECEALTRPGTVREAKRDARSVYRAFNPRAKWL